MSKENPESEKAVEDYVVALARQYRGEAYKFTSPQRANVPDRIITLPGIIFMIECKSEGQTLRPSQRREMDRLRGNGVQVFICDTRASVRNAFAVMLRRAART